MARFIFGTLRSSSGPHLGHNSNRIAVLISWLVHVFEARDYLAALA
jgi:hypothetical protein